MAQILHIGDSLYSLLSKCTRQTFLLLSELLDNLFFFNTYFSLHYSESLAGNVKAHLMNSTAQTDEYLQPHVSFMEALASIFSCINYESSFPDNCILAASIVVKDGDTKLYLSMRDDKLQHLLVPYDPDDVETNDLEEKLLFPAERDNHIQRWQQSHINHNHWFSQVIVV